MKFSVLKNKLTLITRSSNKPNAGAFGIFILTCVNVFAIREIGVPVLVIITINAFIYNKLNN